MNSANPPVVVGIDHFDRRPERRLLRFAALEARARGTSIEVVHGCAADRPPSPAGTPQDENPFCSQDQSVEGAAETLREMTAGEVAVTLSTPALTGWEALVRASASACLVVVQRRTGAAVSRLVAGSTSSTVAAQAFCPVVVMHGEDRTVQQGPVVVGVDAHGHGEHAIGLAADEAGWRRLPLTALHAWVAAVDRPPYVGYVPADDDPTVSLVRASAERSLAEAVAGFQETHPEVDIRRQLLHGDSVDCLVAASRSATLLVVARHSSPHLASFGLGHVARALISRAHCPVMVTAPARPAHLARAGSTPARVRIG